MINPIFTSEGISSTLQERKSQLRTYQFPMNCSICLSVMAMFVAYQSYEKFRDVGSRLILMAVSIGSDVCHSLSRVGMWSPDRLH